MTVEETATESVKESVSRVMKNRMNFLSVSYDYVFREAFGLYYNWLLWLVNCIQTNCYYDLKKKNLRNCHGQKTNLKYMGRSKV